MLFFIKNLGIIICCIYCYFKLLHLPNHFHIANSIFTILLSILSIYTDTYYPYITNPIFILTISFYLSYQTKTLLSTSITTATISFALSYIVFAFSSMLTGYIFLLLFGKNIRIPAQLSCCLIHLLLMHTPFIYKRTKNGMPFLYHSYYSIPGMVISLLIIFTSILVRFIKTDTFNSFYIIPIILVFFLAFLIYLYWKNNLTKTYLDRLNERNLTDLTHTISLQSEQIAKLEEENTRLAKIIHKDNKLIPAMELAVENYLNASIISEGNPSESISTGTELLEQLKKLSAERKGILQHQDIQNQQLIPTKVMNVDNLLAYMRQKAIAENIIFQTNISCDIQYFIENVISEDELTKLLADLLENAIIATRYNHGHYILLSIRIISNAYTISIFDSGIPFVIDVFRKWGLEQITTHADNGGSGIGMIETYEIIKKYHASFHIHELGTDYQTFTKEITVSFNKLNQYTLQTHRPEEELSLLAQRTDLHIIRP